MSADRYPEGATNGLGMLLRVRELEEALRKVRRLAIPAGVGFVRRHPDGPDKCREVLDIIDNALAGK